MEPFAAPKRRPWVGEAGLESVLGHWRTSRAVSSCLALDHTFPSELAALAGLPEGLTPQVRQALGARGLHQLYAHQVAAIELALARRDVVVATPTSSGKSLCYHVPVLDALARDPAARALYLFPTKALSRDQEDAIRRLMADAQLAHGATTFDGDTPADARRLAKDRAGVVVTNPDMLHTGILPHHTQWARLFSHLQYVVVDELHAYRGIFGSHLANVLRRLERVARFHGSQPTFVFASATIGNPAGHAARMLGREVTAVSESGAPRGERHLFVYNPPVVNAELGIRASYVKRAVQLTAELLRARVPTLLFGQSRNTVEVMLKYLREAMQEQGMDPALVTGYRGGYLPGTRRSTEVAMREGQVLCAVATSALELGIDVGSLDAVVCAGYPGSMAGLFQRFGRAGRRQASSAAVLVCSSHPLDQYFALHPELLIGAPVEEARIDPDNAQILIQQLKCAAFELPFHQSDGFRELDQGATVEALGFLAQHRVLHRAADTYHWASDVYPAQHVSLRSAGWDNVVVVELGTDRVLAEMDFPSAHTMLHDQAIYQHDAEQFQVERLDLPNKKAFVRKVASDYFTTAMTHVRVSVIEEDAHAALLDSEVRSALGEVSVVEKVVGFKKIKFHTHENVGYGEVTLPELQMHTSAFWLTLPEEVVARVAAPRPAVIDALKGIAHALHTVACVGLMMDPHDVRSALGSADGDGGAVLFNPTIFLYDAVPGGVGLSARMFEQRDEMLRRARRTLERCGCEDGCPACIGPAQTLASVTPLQVARKPLCFAVLDELGTRGLAEVHAP